MTEEVRKKIVESISGVKKERDYLIVRYQALNPQATYTEIKSSLQLEISENTVGQIVATNWDAVIKLYALENYLAMPEGRAFERARAYFSKKKNGVETKKDPLDILNDMEDDSVKIDNSTHKTYAIFDYSKLTEEDIGRIHDINNRISKQVSAT